MSDLIQEAINSLTELRRMHQLNFELIEELSTACQYITDNNINVPNQALLRSLVGKSLSLISELQAETPKTLQYKKIADEKKHLFRTDEEETEPSFIMLLYLVRRSWIIQQYTRCGNKI